MQFGRRPASWRLKWSLSSPYAFCTSASSCARKTSGAGVEGGGGGRGVLLAAGAGGFCGVAEGGEEGWAAASAELSAGAGTASASPPWLPARPVRRIRLLPNALQPLAIFLCSSATAVSRGVGVSGTAAGRGGRGGQGQQSSVGSSRSHTAKKGGKECEHCEGPQLCGSMSGCVYELHSPSKYMASLQVKTCNKIQINLKP